VLAGSAEVGGETVTVVAEGVLADLAARIAGLAAAPVQVEPPPGLTATLRPYQRRGMAWLAGMCEAGLGGCLADDMGLGKTIQVIALHLHRREAKVGPTLVVCPASLLGTWEHEVRRFAPDVAVRRYHGGGRHLEDLAADEMVLVTYGVVLRDPARLAEVGWGLVVADEAQHAKNPLPRSARELRAVPAPARIALTGTPVANRLSELWAILDWTAPGLLGHLEAFTRRVAVPVERYRDAEATTRFAALIRPFLLRRRKTDPGIAPELPRKTTTDVFVPLTAEQVTLYEAIVRETMAAIETRQGIERAGLVFKLLTALKQIRNHPAQYLKQPAPLDGRSGKLAAFDELTDVILANGELVGQALAGSAGAAGTAGPRPATARPRLCAIGRGRRTDAGAGRSTRPGSGPQDRAVRGQDPGAAVHRRRMGPGTCRHLGPPRPRGRAAGRRAAAGDRRRCGRRARPASRRRRARAALQLPG
jgi:SNF2 family DNA or RNA helicase